MKKSVITLAILIAGLSVNAGAECRKDPDVRKQERQVRCLERKEKRQQEMDEWKKDMEHFKKRLDEDGKLNSLVDSLAGEQAKAAVDNKSFVLEADYVTFRNGNRVSVNSGTNFISVYGDDAVVQISPSTYYAGPNGVGGVTVKGKVYDIKKYIDKKGRTNVSMSVSGVGINAQVDIYIYPGSNRVTATVTPNFNSNSVSFEGTIVPYANSSVFEGLSM